MTNNINKNVFMKKLFRALFFMCCTVIFAFVVANLLNTAGNTIIDVRNSYSIGYINGEKVITEIKPYVCTISYWKDDCRDVVHQIICSNCVEFIELLYEEQDTEQYEFVNCTISDNGDVVGKKCDLKTYTKKGVYELWLTNVTINNQTTICYFSFDKQQTSSGEYVNDPSKIKMFSVFAPQGIFQGYLLHDVSDKEYQLASDIFRGVGPICVVTEYR
ncbi:MAG: hypothetical protein KAS04_07160 [Candidatus Aenigmarchaeota archaeon]|nr:hypothetical protein [Candidatus Aenigmarchaeota archaeon]